MESSKWLAMVLLALLVMLGVEWSEGCLEEERLALFRLKSFFPFIDYRINDLDPDYFEEKETSSDCCEWQRVECNPTTGRITHLFLNQSYIFDEDGYFFIDFDWQNERESWYLNVSLFLPFDELQSLSLTGNFIAGCVDKQGFEMLSSKLDKLEILDLSRNNFNNSILASLSQLSSLKSLNLALNQFTGSNPSKGINMLSKLSNLEILDLSSNSLGNNILPQLGGFTSLISLHLQDCGLKGTVDMQELWLMNLEVLDLYGNFFDSGILSYLVRLPNLKILSFGGQELKGPIDIKELTGLSNLEELNMGCYYSDGGCSLSLQSFGLFPSLKTLSLFGFSFNETTMASNQKSFCGLANLHLRVLVLANSNLKGNLSECFSNFTSLESLDLYGNQFSGDVSALKTLTSLERLSLSSNQFSGDVSALKTLTSLERLDLSSNQFSGDVSALKTLTSLERLSLSSNQFSGDVSALKTLISLERLDLSYNDFSGDVSALKTLTSLERLDLSSNQFSGDISALKTLTSLKELILSNNYFQIPSSLSPFFNLSKLKDFYADNNTIYVESEMQSLVPRFQLSSISLSCCGDAGQFPQFLYHQRDLRIVDLSNVNLKGEFPNWLLQNNSNLRGLYLANNSLQGPFELSFNSHTDLSSLDISKNFFHHKIPNEIGAKLPSLRLLNMSKNHFHGNIPPSVGDMNSLGLLDLSDNLFSGELPENLAMRCFSLYSLTLSNNRLQGQMFSSKFNLTNLRELHLDGNQFTGNIPDSLSNCSVLSTLDLSNNKLYGEIPRWMENMSRLSTLDLSKNKLSGEIPRWMGKMTSLEEIVLANNHLEGPFPVEFCHLNLNLKLLDLSVNNISGSLPSCFSPLWISQVHLSTNKLEGPLTNVFRNSTILVTLDLSNNQLTGKIPNWIGNLSQLSYLLLNNNHFEGGIPVQLCNLGHLSLLDLSNNNLTGTIPPCLKITTLNEISQDYVRYVAAVAQAPSSFSTDEPVQFTSKNNSYSYKGRLLTLLSGIDLSCNKLTGEIPNEVKDFRNLYALNLSHNRLIGPIPLEFSELKQIESLDLSHNNLSGKIPRQLMVLYSLSSFSVAYNNLSGSTPDLTAQFSTFGESSYVGNPFLCGKPLPKNCTTSGPSPSLLPKASNDDGLIDMTAFYASFVVSFVMVILTIASVLYINPHWRRAWFYHIGAISTRCYYFLEDHILPKKFHCGNM